MFLKKTNYFLVALFIGVLVSGFFSNQSFVHAEEIVSSTSYLPSSLLFPSNLFAFPISATRINLEWPRVDRADGYVLYRSTDNNKFTPLTIDKTHLMFPDADLTPSTTYYYKITAQRFGKETESSPLITIRTIGSDVLPPPQSLIAELIVTSSKTMVTLSWNSVNSSTPQYVVYRRTNASEFSALFTTEAGVPTYTDENLGDVSATTTFYYKVAAKNPQGEGVASQVIYVRIAGSGGVSVPSSIVPEQSLASIGNAEEMMTQETSKIQFKNIATDPVYDAKKMMRFSYNWMNSTSERRFVMRRTVVDESGKNIIERKTYSYVILPQKSKTLYVNDWLYAKGKRLAPGQYTLQVEVLKYPYKVGDVVDKNSFRFEVQ